MNGQAIHADSLSGVIKSRRRQWYKRCTACQYGKHSECTGQARKKGPRSLEACNCSVCKEAKALANLDPNL